MDTGAKAPKIPKHVYAALKSRSSTGYGQAKYLAAECRSSTGYGRLNTRLQRCRSCTGYGQANSRFQGAALLRGLRREPRVLEIGRIPQISTMDV